MSVPWSVDLERFYCRVVSTFSPFTRSAQNHQARHNRMASIGWLEFYILATSKVIWGRVQTCDSACSSWLHSAVQVRNQAASKTNHSITLSWRWANQSLAYTLYAEQTVNKCNINASTTLAVNRFCLFVWKWSFIHIFILEVPQHWSSGHKSYRYIGIYTNNLFCICVI